MWVLLLYLDALAGHEEVVYAARALQRQIVFFFARLGLSGLGVVRQVALGRFCEIRVGLCCLVGKHFSKLRVSSVVLFDVVPASFSELQ